jgi:hypothetical protein
MLCGRSLAFNTPILVARGIALSRGLEEVAHGDVERRRSVGVDVNVDVAGGILSRVAHPLLS